MQHPLLRIFQVAWKYFMIIWLSYLHYILSVSSEYHFGDSRVVNFSQFLTIKYFNSDWCSSGWDFFSLPWRREHLSKPLKISEAVFLELSLVPMGVWHTAAVNHFHKQKSNFWNLRVSVGSKIYQTERDFLNHKAQSLMTFQKGITTLDFPSRFLCQTSVNGWIGHLHS